MEQMENRPKTSDEIDLTQFLRWIGRGFRRMGNGVLFSIATLRNLLFENRLFFGGIIAIGLILGAVYSELLKKTYYKSTMVLSCDYLNTQILQNTIDKLNLLAKETEREGLAEVLRIDIATAKNIQEFEFRPFVSEDDVVEMEVLREQLNNVAAQKKDLVDKVMMKLEIENKNAYEISVLVYDPEIVKPLETALVTFFNTNEYIKRRIEINSRNLKARKAKLVSESRKLDSLKRAVFESYQNLGKTSKGSGNVILGDEKVANPIEIFEQDLKLHQELMSVERQIHIGPDFEVVDGFTTFKQPESASLATILVISFFISWAMGYLIIGAWRFDKMLSEYPTKRA